MEPIRDMKFALCLRLIDRLLQSLSLLDGLGNLTDAARDTLGTNLSKETCQRAYPKRSPKATQ